MNEKPRTMRRVLGIGLAWSVLWLAFWAMVASIIGIADPDSIDPGEGPLMMLAILGPMGFATGILFGAFLSLRSRGKYAAELPLPRVAGWGILATAIVQVAYLGHGDQGLVANLGVALLFAVAGGIVSVLWLAIARRWSHGRPSVTAAV